MEIEITTAPALKPSIPKQLPPPSSDFYQFADLLSAEERAILGSPTLTPELQKKLIDGLRAVVVSRTIDELEAERDEILLGLLELRIRRPDARREVAAE